MGWGLENRRGRTTQTLTSCWEVGPASDCGTSGPGQMWAEVNISRLPTGLQAEPERARFLQALQSQPRQGPSRSNSGCLGRSRWEPQGTRAAGAPGPSPPPQAPRVSRPLLSTSRGPGDVTAALTRANGGTGVLRGGPGPCSPLPRPWPSSRRTSIFQIREGRLSFGY